MASPPPVYILVVLLGVLLVASRAFAFEGEGIAQVVDRDDRRAGTDFMVAEAALKGAEAKFRGFIRTYGKVYATEEERKFRFKAFRHNLMKAIEHQALDPTAVHGVTEFSDLTEDEFAARFLGLKAPEAIEKAPSGPDLPTGDLPIEFDWRKLGAVTPVKNQVQNISRFLSVLLFGSPKVPLMFPVAVL
jgi:cathepsin F